MWHKASENGYVDMMGMWLKASENGFMDMWTSCGCVKRL